MTLTAAPDLVHAAALGGWALEAGKQGTAMAWAASPFSPAILGLTAPITFKFRVSQSSLDSNLPFTSFYS